MVSGPEAVAAPVRDRLNLLTGAGIALLRLLCTCIQLLSGAPVYCSLVYGPFPESDMMIHEDAQKSK